MSHSSFFRATLLLISRRSAFFQRAVTCCCLPSPRSRTIANRAQCNGNRDQAGANKVEYESEPAGKGAKHIGYRCKGFGRVELGIKVGGHVSNSWNILRIGEVNNFVYLDSPFPPIKATVLNMVTNVKLHFPTSNLLSSSEISSMLVLQLLGSMDMAGCLNLVTREVLFAYTTVYPICYYVFVFVTLQVQKLYGHQSSQQRWVKHQRCVKGTKGSFRRHQILRRNGCL
jgi:hypothetical protein